LNAPRKRLFIFSLDSRVNRFLVHIAGDILGEKVAITGASLDMAPIDFPGADLILTSGAHLAARTRELFPGVPVLSPRRIVTGYNLEKVLMLPAGTPTLVVNHPEAATAETIASLKALGLDHLRYIPFWQGRESDTEVARTQTAISPGMAHLCPAHVHNCIDIGPRLISMASFARLLAALGLGLDDLERYANTYHGYLVEASRKLAGTLTRVELLAKRNEIILHQVDEGLLLVDDRGRIDQANRAAQRLLAPGGEALVNRSLPEILSTFEKIADLIEAAAEDDKSASIYLLGDKQVIVTRIPVISGLQRTHLFTLREIAGIQRLEKSVRVKLARRGYLTKYHLGDIRGRSPALKAALERAARFAMTDKTILITGETGTGKELFAHAMHAHSLRRDGPFVAVNFAGLPQTLIESELFGYAEGAFTGALKGGKAGLFEQAHGGTIFLDEIGDAAPEVQARLLRVLQEREILRVGGSRIVPVDVRVIAATNTDLGRAMAEGRFRQDLYYRLNALPLEIPPLRQRGEDILDLFHHFQQRQYGLRKPLAAEAEACLVRYPWPGNVRELIGAVDYAAIASQGLARIDRRHLPPPVQRQASPAAAEGGETPPSFAPLRLRLAATGIDPARMQTLLGAMAASEPAPVGRQRLCRHLADQGLPMGEGRLRTLMGILRREGMVAVGTTRQGTTLTPKGRALLDALRANPDPSFLG